MQVDVTGCQAPETPQFRKIRTSELTRTPIPQVELKTGGADFQPNPQVRYGVFLTPLFSCGFSGALGSTVTVLSPFKAHCSSSTFVRH